MFLENQTLIISIYF